MSTTMPDEPTVAIEPDHVTQLRENGPGSLILCDFDNGHVRVGEVGTVPDNRETIIAGIDDITAMTELTLSDQTEAGDAAVAAELSHRAKDFGNPFPTLTRSGPRTHDLRTTMIEAGFTLTGSTEYRCRMGSQSITDRYLLTEDPNLRVNLTTDRAFIFPARAEIRDLRHVRSLMELDVGLSGEHPDSAPRIVAAAVAAALHG